MLTFWWFFFESCISPQDDGDEYRQELEQLKTSFSSTHGSLDQYGDIMTKFKLEISEEKEAFQNSLQKLNYLVEDRYGLPSLLHCSAVPGFVIFVITVDGRILFPVRSLLGGTGNTSFSRSNNWYRIQNYNHQISCFDFTCLGIVLMLYTAPSERTRSVSMNR